MSIFHNLLGRRNFLASAAVGSSLIMPVWAQASEAVDEALSGGSGAGGAGIRPFKFRATEAALADLKRRIAASKWTSEELVPEFSFASPLRQSCSFSQ